MYFWILVLMIKNWLELERETSLCIAYQMRFFCDFARRPYSQWSLRRETSSKSIILWQTVMRILRASIHDGQICAQRKGVSNLDGYMRLWPMRNGLKSRAPIYGGCYGRKIERTRRPDSARKGRPELQQGSSDQNKGIKLSRSIDKWKVHREW